MTDQSDSADTGPLPSGHSGTARLTKPENTPDRAWALFEAAARGDVEVITDICTTTPELRHHEIWYDIPLHYAVRGGHLPAVDRLLQLQSNPAVSSFTYSSWPRLLTICDDLHYPHIRQRLVAEMQQRFRYGPRYPPLWDAIHRGDQPTFDRLLENDPELVHISDGHGNRALHWAVLSRRPRMIRRLLECGADITALRADWQTPLHLSVEGDYWFRKTEPDNPHTSPAEITALLLEHGAPQEFCVAAALGDQSFVSEQLQQQSALATSLNAARRSPLAHAARGGHHEIVATLLQNGADPNLAEHCAPRGAALFHACARIDLTIMSLLLQHGADPNGEFDSSGNCLSIVPSGPQQQRAQQILMNAGAQRGLWEFESADDIAKRLADPAPFEPTADLWGSLLNAILKLDDIGLLDRFCERFGASVICTMNPTHGWRLPTSESMLARLRQRGLDINATDWFGATFLHHVVAEASTDRLTWLLRSGADPNCVELESGMTPLGLAAAAGNTAATTLLLQHQARPDLPSHVPLQPVEVARRGGHMELAKLIQRLA
ncbi:MAG: ankyrin repeat domain-containing protein [Planctomycetaceae bacterium]|nr:ankyrin repeat domain-containing protein [Planctomycetaceae bacterium]